jgi:hypothetical protein
MELRRHRDVHVGIAKRVRQLEITRDKRPGAAFSGRDSLLLILIGVVTRAALWLNYQPQI